MAEVLSSIGIVSTAHRIAHRFDEPYLTRMLADVRQLEAVLALALTSPKQAD